MEEVDDIMRHLHSDILYEFKSGERRVSADEVMISQFEEEIGHRLPPDYRAFLTRYGGASVYKVVFEMSIPDSRFDSEDVFSVSDFLGFYSEMNQAWDLRANYRDHKGIFPAGMVAFAAAAENRFCLSCAGATLDYVYGWMPPEFDDDDPAGELVLLARSFLDFLRGLRIGDD